MFLNFGASLACEKVRVFNGSAGAIYVGDNFTQSSGTLTITNASAEKSGGVVDLGAPQRGISEMLFEVAPRAVLRFIRSRFQGFTCCV